MPTKETLRERIQLVESRIFGMAVRVLNLRMRTDYALADVYVEDNCLPNRKYRYSAFFKSSQLKIK